MMRPATLFAMQLLCICLILLPCMAQSDALINPHSALLTKESFKNPANSELLPREILCNDPSWDPTIANWIDEKVDEKLVAWWNSVKDTRGGVTFVDLLSTSFGDMSRGQECGIGKRNCFVPDCQPFKDRGGPRWVYFVRYSIVQMHSFFNNLYDAANTAEADFTAVIPDLTDNFFPWEVKVDLNAAQPWITAVVQSIFEFIPGVKLALLAPTLLKKAVPDLLESTQHFAAAGTTYIGSPTEIIEKKMGTMKQLGELIKSTTQELRAGIDKWSAGLFTGNPDRTGKSIIDYFGGGRFLLPFMAASEMSEYMFQVRVAWLVNHQWLANAKDHTKKFVMCANSTTVPCDDDSRYSDGNRTCCLYQINGRAKYEEQKDLKKLRGSTYNFNISDITASSVRSYLSRGYDMSDRNVTETIYNSLSVDDSQFFSQGVRADGVFTIPVCDVGGDASWVAKWDADPRMLPCCCGPHCWETLDFFNASAFFRWRDGTDDRFKAELDARCVKQYDRYLSAWSRGTLSTVPQLHLIGGIFALAIALTVLL